MAEYNHKTVPYAHQSAALQDSWSAAYYALFMEMGTGKSKVALDTVAMLHEAGELSAVLVVAPKGVYDNWILAEIPAHLPLRIKRSICRWTPSRSQKFNKELKNFVQSNQLGLKIFVMNVEAFSRARGTEAAAEFLHKNPNNMVIVDESTTIKNRKSLRTRNILSLRKFSKYRRILTGSPVTKSPLDLYSQCSFLSVAALGFKSYLAFQARYATVQTRYIGFRTFREVTGYRRLPELSTTLEKFSNRVLKKDCLDLPPKVYVRREVMLTKEQQELYSQMKRRALARLEDGELSTTASVLTQIMRLQQICCGHLKMDSGDILPLNNNRLNDLLDVAEELQGKAIIWATYTRDILQIAQALCDRFGPGAAATYFGATPQDDRQKIVADFQSNTGPLRFFVGQPKTGGFGITLTAANTVIYFSNSYDLEIRLQSEDRAHRIGQQNKVTYIDLVSPGTIDDKILTALRNKINIAGQVLGEKTLEWLQ
jgi:SNF2 family DNA or RNA helicase|tara:strand:- start:377 stop:1825 length:1449 start_codon:yes stop_codon:yes gene_type:complete